MNDRHQLPPLLRPQQRTILTLVANGHSTRAIGRHIGVNESSASRFIRDICRLLEARDRTHAVINALRAGELTLEDCDPDRKAAS